jgi:glutathione S-transferase
LAQSGALKRDNGANGRIQLHESALQHPLLNNDTYLGLEMLTLVIGNKNYSSWSLRPWLAMKVASLTFTEIRIALDQPDTKATILRYAPNGKVPCLIDAGRDAANPLTVWDSLAICEYVNEVYARGTLWPADPRQRAVARAAVAEMHSGFANVRAHLSMDIRNRKPEHGARALGRPEVQGEVARIRSIWSTALAASGGPFLFGPFSIADAFYAPVVTRFATYAVPLDDTLAAYSTRIFDLAPMQAWVQAARAEPEVLPEH